MHVSAPNRVRPAEPGVTMHRAAVAGYDRCRRSGLWVTSSTRTLVDCGRSLPWEESVVLMDSALRAGLPVAELERAAAAARGPGAAAVRAAVAAADACSKSALESLLRLVLTRAGLQPTMQAVISDEHGFVARVDFLFVDARIVVEADGWEEVRSRPDEVVSLVRDLLARA